MKNTFIRNNDAKQIKHIRKILKSMGYLKPSKKESERKQVINEGRF